MTFADYGAVLIMGLLGSGHCIGMCAPFALAVGVGGGGGGGARRRAAVARHVAYQFGKATSYVFLGLLLLAAGELAGSATSSMSPASVQGVVAWVAGLVMVGLGLGYALEWRPALFTAAAERLGGGACGVMRALWQSTSVWKSVLIGWLNGFLPCGLSLAALLYLVGQGSVLGVVTGAYVFGFATLPGLLLVTLAGHRVSADSRRWLTRLAGVVLVVFGVLMLLRSAGVVGGHGHDMGHEPPASRGVSCCKG
ncbi:sulfite exporter TauE/SafE family protein [Opitutaceae bacterium TAV4]|nr:sulfite exporter TauE/SafE family protein [Opitutaceae bacterium TAV4]